MNYYETVVIDYLRADRSIFVNTEYCIQLEPGNPDTSGPHWYCDAVALDLCAKKIFLCEISYADKLADLTKRLQGWHDHWDQIRVALKRHCYLAEAWPIHPWLFIRQDHDTLMKKRLDQIANGQPKKFDCKITHFEEVQPWLYSSHDRKRTVEPTPPSPGTS